MNKMFTLNRDGTLWLIALYLLLSIIVTSSSYYQLKQQELDTLSRGLYDPASVSFTLQDSNQLIDWRKLDAEKNFTLFNELGTGKYDIRGFYFKGDTYIPPVQSGRYFTNTDFYRGKRLAVLGKHVADENVFKQNGKEYYRYGGMKFEIIGKMGASYPSKLEKTVLLNLDALNHLKEVQTNLYVMNSDQKTIVKDHSLSINHDRVPIKVIDQGDHGAQRYISMDSYQRVIIIAFVGILIGSSLLFTQYWLRKKRTEIRVLWQLGFSIREVYRRVVIHYILIISACYWLVCLASSITLAVLGVISQEFLVPYTLNLLKGYGLILFSSILSIWISKGYLLRQMNTKGYHVL